MHTHTSIAELSDDALIARTRSLVRNERAATAALVAHLAEMDTRRLYLAEGYSSLFVYCTQALHLSEFAAYTRIAAARAGRKFPLVFERLAGGEVHLSAVDLLAPHLTEENHRDLLDRARHRSKRDVERIAAEIAPRPPVVSMVRKLPVRNTTTPLAEEGVGLGADQVGPAPALTGLVPKESCLAPEIMSHEGAVPEPPKTSQTSFARPRTGPRTRVQPLSMEHYKIQFTADPATVELLRRAQDLLRHQIPNGDPAAIFAMALGDLVQKLEKRMAAATARPRAAKPSPAGEAHASGARRPSTTKPVANTRHIPAAVRREVWRRDAGQCAFRARSGRRCSETGSLELHHVEPFARGGRATADNIELRCRAHNQYEAIQVFGERSGMIVRERGTMYWSRDQLEGVDWVAP